MRGIAAEAISESDLVIVAGVDGDSLKFKKADADAQYLMAGVLGVADHDVASGGPLRVVTYKIAAEIDTSSSAIGAPVYLDDGTAGAHVLSAPTEDIIVGQVLVAATVANGGKVLLAPSLCCASVDGGAYDVA
jgi:hypothetical protein